MSTKKSNSNDKTMDIRLECISCSSWFNSQMRIEVEKVRWDAETSEFTGYSRGSFCPSCGHNQYTDRVTLDDPKDWWVKWKTIPISTLKPSECPMCGSDEIRMKNIDTSKDNDEVILVASFVCKKCNSNKQQFIRGSKDFWQRTKSISIGPAEVTFS